MPEATTPPVILTPKILPPRRIKSRGLAIGCALLVVFGLCAASYQVIANSRHMVASTPDPASGYQIEYTISSRYTKSNLSSIYLFAHSNTYSFAPNPQPRLIQWLNLHLLSRTMPTPNTYVLGQ
jgi:hypothetical protein